MTSKVRPICHGTPYSRVQEFAGWKGTDGQTNRFSSIRSDTAASEGKPIEALMYSLLQYIDFRLDFRKTQFGSKVPTQNPVFDPVLTQLYANISINSTK